ncbi:hypothetical protein KX729_30600 [Rhizobium sp. XQZ8]|nr:hypothetical protein [Rhizobium populisoli]MBW6425745.1 hypothetical protein [Rhizobium populisoli]
MQTFLNTEAKLGEEAGLAPHWLSSSAPVFGGNSVEDGFCCAGYRELLKW